MDTNLERIEMVSVYPSKLKNIRMHFQALELGLYGYIVRNTRGAAPSTQHSPRQQQVCLELVWVRNHSF